MGFLPTPCQAPATTSVTLDTLSIVYVPWSRGIEVELSVGEGKLSVGEVKLSVKLTESHSSATEITIAWLK